MRISDPPGYLVIDGSRTVTLAVARVEVYFHLFQILLVWLVVAGRCERVPMRFAPNVA